MPDLLEDSNVWVKSSDLKVIETIARYTKYECHPPCYGLLLLLLT